MKKQDDNISTQESITEIFVKPWDGCAPDVASALRRVVDEITIPLPPHREGRGRKDSYSLTSRSPSIWSQLRRHLDIPLAEAFRSYRGPWASKLLTGFCLSAAGRRPPKWRIDNAAWVEAKRAGDLIDWGGLIVPVSRSTPKNRQKISDADQVLDNVKAWDENLRFVIHSSDAPLPGDVSANEHLQFCATLDTIRSLLDTLHDFRPRTGKDPLNKHDGRLPDTVTRRQNEGYCELCWRHTMRAVGMADQDMPAIKSRRLSNRFCSEHNPSDPSSRYHYRADLRYKEAFQRELLALQRKTVRSAFEVQFHPPRTADTHEVRKAAYDLVHARLRPLTQLEKPGLRESVWLLHERGLRQADIARQLGVTRQSVFRAMRSTKNLLETQRQEQMVRPSSGESWSKSEDSPFVQSVAAFHREGYTAAEIARITGRFKHTVQAVLRWLAKRPQSALN